MPCHIPFRKTRFQQGKARFLPRIRPFPSRKLVNSYQESTQILVEKYFLDRGWKLFSDSKSYPLLTAFAFPLPRGTPRHHIFKSAAQSKQFSPVKGVRGMTGQEDDSLFLYPAFSHTLQGMFSAIRMPMILCSLISGSHTDLYLLERLLQIF